MRLQRSFVVSKFVSKVEEGTRLNVATQNVIRNALARLLDTWDDDAELRWTIKEVLVVCCDKFWSINGAPIAPYGRWEHAQGTCYAGSSQYQSLSTICQLQLQTGQVYSQVAKIVKELTFARREIAYLKNQLHQSEENLAEERAEHASKGNAENSQKDEGGSRRPRQQAKKTKTPKPDPSPLTPLGMSSNPHFLSPKNELVVYPLTSLPVFLSSVDGPGWASESPQLWGACVQSESVRPLFYGKVYNQCTTSICKTQC